MQTHRIVWGLKAPNPIPIGFTSHYTKKIYKCKQQKVPVLPPRGNDKIHEPPKNNILDKKPLEFILRMGYSHLTIAGVAQLVEHLIRNEGVVGSSPITGTTFI